MLIQRQDRMLAVTLAVTLVAAACNPSSTTPSAGSPGTTATASAGATATPTAAPTPTPPPTPGPAQWVAAGALHAARDYTRVVGLTDGRVLVVGDDNICMPGTAWDSSMAAEVWSAGTWTATGSLNSARNDLTAQPLPDGKAMAVGGTNVDWISFSSARIWDPATGTWSLAAGLMATARSFPASTQLPDGKVMVIGGAYHKGSYDKPLATAEIFDPTTGGFTPTGAMKKAHWGASAVTLSDGRVLVAGGWVTSGLVTNSDSEVWDPATGKWTAVGPTPISMGFALVALKDGSALMAGGVDASMNPVALAYRFDPATNKWVAAAKMKTAATNRTAVVLANGQVLVAGGLTNTHKPATTAAELFDPASGTWTATTAMPAGREQAGGVLLPDGSVLLAGGSLGYFPPASTPWCPKQTADTWRYIPAVP